MREWAGMRCRRVQSIGARTARRCGIEGSIAIGSIIAFQVQQFLINGLPFVFSDILVAWRPFVTAIVGLLFFGWLILNNVWFNVVIIVLFDDIMKAKSSREDSVSHFKKPVSDGQSG